MIGPVRYYELDDDKYIPGRWHLRVPRTNEAGQDEVFDIWRFNEGRPLKIEHPIRLSVNPRGHALEYTHALGIPIVHHRVVSLFSHLELQTEVQFIPVQVEGQQEPYFILNALRVIRCIDEARSDQVFHWRPEDGEPERVGQYKNIRGLKIDPTRVEGAHIFRPWGWDGVLIVAERLKSAMQEEGITGTGFVEV